MKKKQIVFSVKVLERLVSIYHISLKSNATLSGHQFSNYSSRYLLSVQINNDIVYNSNIATRNEYVKALSLGSI